MYSNLHGQRILVLDPVPARGQAATSLLRRAGATVRQADSTLSAVIETRQLQFDRILMVGEPLDFGPQTLLLALAANGVTAPVLRVELDTGQGFAGRLMRAATPPPPEERVA